MKYFLHILLSCLYITFSNAATLINDTETEQEITSIITPVVKAADIPLERLKVYIINSDEFNAFVRGGEDVFIYTGLLKQIKSPNALRAVVAHELGHTIGGHMIQMSDRMAAEMTRTLIIQALGIGLMVAGGNASASAGVLAGSAGIAQQSILSFSRDEERMADELGLELMIKADQDPNGFIEIFNQMQEMSGVLESKINPNRINHPLTTERLNNAKEKINSLKKNLKKHNKTSIAEQNRYELIRAKLIGYLNTLENVLQTYPYSNKEDAAIYARAIANMRGGNLATAKTGTQTLINRNPKSPYFYELLGDIEYQYGHYDDSIKAYEQSLKLSNNAPQIQTALALVLSDRNKLGDYPQAIELCKKVILKEASPLAYWILAKVTTGGESDWAMAEFYNMNKDKKNAQKYAKLAQKKSKSTSPEYIKAGDILKQ